MLIAINIENVHLLKMLSTEATDNNERNSRQNK